MEDYYTHVFFRPPFFSPYYYRNNRNYYRQNRVNKDNSNKINSEKLEFPKKEEKNQKCSGVKTSNEPIFELFGIQLFFDDILLISLIFFLYNEGVQDQFLFIALILLLLS